MELARREEFNHERMRGLADQVDWKDHDSRAAAMASLVEGVYNFEHDNRAKKNLQPLSQNGWCFFDFEKKHELKDTKDSSIYGVVYEVKDPSQNHSPESGPPRYVVAFRGTILGVSSSGRRDMKLNIKIMTDRLHKDKPRFQHALQSVEQLVEKAGPENVWLAGHSQGAAIAMMIGKNMALKGKHLETFLFNPPFLGSSHLKTSLLKITGNKYLREGIQFTKAVCNLGIFSVAGSGKRQQQYEQFIALSSWMPRLFVNQSDPICSKYIEHFRNVEKMKKIGAGMPVNVAAQHSVRSALKTAFGKDPSIPLLPEAYLTVTKTSRNIFKAHRLKQWWNQKFTAPGHTGA